jgi:uncharacterized membrane protein YcaP (DUF421 family)
MKEAFQDVNGQMSMTRVMSFMVVFMIMLGWCIVSGIQHRLVELDPSLIMMIATSMGWKTVQRFAEKKDVVVK